jgi:aminoglycoside phosphotransferase (APT) family kinase protein
MSATEPDPKEILAALGATGAAEIIPVRGGQDTLIWRVDTNGTRYALRLFRAGEERKCAREVASMCAVAAGGVPVPIVHADGVWHGRPALLLSWVPGQTLLGAFRTQPRRIIGYGAMFGQMHAKIHALPGPTGPQYSPDRWLDWAGPVDAPLRERLLSLVRRPLAMCHFDYHPLNVMTDGARVTAVLDWPNALPADPRADLARTIALMRFPPRTTLTAIERAAVRIFLFSWWRAYRRAAGPVTEMAAFYAWAGTATLLDQEAKPQHPNMARDGAASFDPLRRWTAMWRRRAGLPPG